MLLLIAVSLTVVAAGLPAFTAAPVVATWRAFNANGSISVPAHLPGALALDVCAPGTGLCSPECAEPYMNECVDEMKWIVLEPVWQVVAVNVSVPADVAAVARQAGAALDMYIERLDMRADVYVAVMAGGGRSGASAAAWPAGCGVPQLAFVGNNAHVPAVVPLPTQAAEGAALCILINFTSPVQYAASAMASCPSMSAFCPSATLSPMYDGFNGAPYIRKEQSSFGWDFAPAFAPSGVYGDLLFRAYVLHIADVCVQTHMIACAQDGTCTWNVTFTAYVELSGAVSALNVTFAVDVPGVGAVAASGEVSDGEAFTLSMSGVSAQPWWPAGLGSPTLYAANVTASVSGSVVSTFPLRLGFREVSLHQPVAPGGGNSFYFTVNGQPVWVKGSNYVPADAFQTRINSTITQALINAFVAANFNTIRVWGGGHYPRDEFYEMAQEAGLLVWQEFMFACQLSPTSPAFLSSVADEVTAQARRLQKYSLLLWSGNNEVETLRVPFGSNVTTPYALLNWATVMRSAAAVDAERPAVGSSPSNGNETESAPASWDANSPHRGDMHFYTYNTNCWDTSVYPRARFASEYGWQSFSSLIAVSQTISPESWYYWSPVMVNRDHHPSQPMDVILYHNVGQNWRIPGPQPSPPPVAAHNRNRLTGHAAELANEVRRATPPPPLELDEAGRTRLSWDAADLEARLARLPGAPAADNVTIFRDTLWMTQVAQAYCVKTEAEHYRRLQNDCAPGSADGGCTMGSLYWMANAMWDGAEKSSLEWAGPARWKVLHYYARRFYAPWLVSANLDWASQNVSVWVSQHRFGAQPLEAVVLSLSVWSWSRGFVGTVEQPVTLNGTFGAQQVWTSSLQGLLAAAGGCAPVLDCTLSYALWNGSNVLADNFLLLAPMANVSTMRDPGLAITNVEPVPDEPGTFAVTITAATLPAAIVWLESLLPGWFSDNAQLMTASPTVAVFTCTLSPPPTAGQVAASLSVWSLWDVAPYGAQLPRS